MNESPNPPKDNQCFNCGYTLESATMVCPYCRAAMPTQGSSKDIALRAILILFSGAFTLVLGLVGMSFLFSVFTSTNFTTFLGSALFGVILLTLTAIGVRDLIRDLREMKDNSSHE